MGHVLREVIAAAQLTLKADRGSVWLLDGDGGEVVLHVGTGLAGIRQPLQAGITGACPSQRAIVNVPDCSADQRFNRAHDEASGYRTRNLLAIRLVGHDESLVGVLQALNKREGPCDAADEGLVVALAAQCAVAIQRAKMTAALVEAEQYRRELEVAQSVQRSTFPSSMPSVRGYEVHGVCCPAGLIGGDTFDVALVGNALLLALADATGPGIGPALSVARLHPMLQMAFHLGARLEETLQRSNQLLAESLEEDRFITAFLEPCSLSREPCTLSRMPYALRLLSPRRPPGPPPPRSPRRARHGWVTAARAAAGSPGTRPPAAGRRAPSASRAGRSRRRCCR